MTHSTPFISGDSGGPLIAPEGLIGIGSRSVLAPSFLFHLARRAGGVKPATITGYSAVAFAPDPAWLQTTITQDRLQQQAKPTVSSRD
jgi:hypothetical protein